MQSTSPAFTLYQNNCAKKIQRSWRQWEQNGALVSVEQMSRVDKTAKHQRSDFDFFLHGQAQAQMSLKPQWLEQLHQAIQQGDWKHPIFESKFLQQLTLSLFFNEKITYHQACTLLAWAQTKSDYPIEKIVYSHHTNGQWNPKFEQMLDDLLETLCPRNYFYFFKKEQKFMLLQEKILKLPLSERMIYTTKQERIRTTQLGANLISHHFMFTTDQKGHAMHLPFGLRKSVMETLFPSGFFEACPRLGSFSKEEIEEGIRQKKRFSFSMYPHVSPFGSRSKTIHGHENVDAMLGLAHDIYHSMKQTFLGDSIVSMLLRCVDVFRKKTGFKWSKEIWHGVDQEFYSPPAGRYEIENWISENIFLGGSEGPLFVVPKSGFLNLLMGRMSYVFSVYPTCFGLSFVFDMIENESTWRNELQIDPTKFSKGTELQKIHAFLKEIHFFMETLSFEKKCLFSYFFFFLKENEIDFCIEHIPRLIESLLSAFSASKIELIKIKRPESNREFEKNMVVLTVNRKSVSDHLLYLSCPNASIEEGLSVFIGRFI